MLYSFSRGHGVHAPLDERLEDWCIECGEPRHTPDHDGSVYVPPELVHPYRPFRLSLVELYERTTLDESVVGSAGFPHSWYASDVEFPFELDPVEAMACMALEHEHDAEPIWSDDGVLYRPCCGEVVIAIASVESLIESELRAS